MTANDPDRLALAAGFVTGTLSEAEVAQARTLLASDEEFARVVREFRETYGAESDPSLTERVWKGIERRLTSRRN